MLIVNLIFLSMFYAGAEPNEPVVVQPPSHQVPDNIISIGRAIIADKATRTLTLWESQNGTPRFVAAYPMDIGKNNGDKMSEGDHKTPNGIYFPQKRMDKNELSYNEYGIRAFTLDYPNFFDQRIGKTGSGIWIHAIPPTTSLNRGSRGCVVVRNETIEAITPFIQLGKTAVIITEKVNYISTEQMSSISNKILSWLGSWKSNWESKNIDTYMANYDETFKALKMNKTKWQEYKSSLNSRYKQIQVQLSDIQILKHNDQLVMRFMQDYKSDALQDFGLKTLYVAESNGEPKILTETWEANTTSQNRYSQFDQKDQANF